MIGARRYGESGLPDSWCLGELSIVRKSLRCRRSVARVSCYSVPSKLIGFSADRIQVNPWDCVPIPSSVTRRHGRSRRFDPFAFKTPGKPIKREALAVAVSILTVLSLYLWSKTERALANRAAWGGSLG